MNFTIDTKVCRKVKCRRFERIVKIGYCELLKPHCLRRGDDSKGCPLPNCCPYKNLHIISGISPEECDDCKLKV